MLLQVSASLEDVCCTMKVQSAYRIWEISYHGGLRTVESRVHCQSATTYSWYTQNQELVSVRGVPFQRLLDQNKNSMVQPEWQIWRDMKIRSTTTRLYWKRLREE